ncbi:stAR-related lipid transfer protein 9 [Trichomycterus rosablanca]|uniref:stAR-related lipid transfer protein 9 n=1 Tax=Trichomycterus rosablanca TaxID=2290929 RepID=UPI002F3532BF
MIENEKECLSKTYSVNENFQATLSGPHELAYQNCSPEKPVKKNAIALELNGQQNASSSKEGYDEYLKLEYSTSIEELNKQTTVSKLCQPLERYCTPELQRDNQAHISQRVVSRKVYTCSQTELTSVTNEQPNHYTTKNQASSMIVQEEKKHDNQLQSQQSSILTEPVKIPDHDMREVLKPDPDSLAICEKTNMNPNNQVRTESTEETEPNGMEYAKHSYRINDDRHRVKLKKYRKAHFTAPPSSSTDSTPDSSMDEIAKIRVHKSTLVKNCKPAIGTPNLVIGKKHTLTSEQSAPQSSVDSPGPKDLKSIHFQSLGSDTDSPHSFAEFTNDVMLDVAKEADSIIKRHHHVTSKLLQNPSVLSEADKAVNSAKISSSKHLSPDSKLIGAKLSDKTSIQNREPVIHFASSDINPFTHTGKGDHLPKANHKNQAFGSDVNIPSQLCSDKSIARSYSVDNGLNCQNSPFNSHLSTYAMQKQLSSTLSTSDSKEHISIKSQIKGLTNTSFVCQRKTLSTSNIDKFELGRDSGQVDKTVPVYSPDHEVQQSTQGYLSKCDHGTQTVKFEDLKKNNRHQRSSTQVPVSRPSHGTSNTWASLQNMSEHLSELIHSTSDLLGNIQSMRTEEKCFKYVHPIKRCSKGLNVYPGMYGKSNGSTQSAIDIGIQTEDTPLILDNCPSVGRNKPQEVNLIVKVIGSEVCSLPKQDGGVSNFSNLCDQRQPFVAVESIPDLRPERSLLSKDFAEKLDALKVLSLETVGPNQNSPNPKVLSSDKVDHIHNNSLFNSVGVCAQSKYTTDMLARENQLQKKPKSKLDKQALFIDRASSPILTVDIPRCLQKGKSAQYLSNQNISTMHNPTETQFSRTVRNPPENKHMLTSSKSISQPCHLYTHRIKKVCKNKPASSVSLENVSQIHCTDADESYPYPTEISTTSKCSSSVRHKKPDDCNQNALLCSTPINQRNRTTMQEYKHRPPEGNFKSWSDLSKDTLQYQEEDIMSVAPSECNTDILVSINPFSETSPLQDEHRIPENLPMHNKFTHWSGISQHGSARLINEKAVDKLGINPNSFQLHSAESESLGYRHKPEFLEGEDRCTREIEKLRKERQQVLSSMHLDTHYGLGRRDTLLKMLKSSSRVESTHSTKQQLYERHRRSIDGLTKEREAHLQTSRRARSLSPGEHANSSNHKTEQLQRTLNLPSQQREYLQQLRREVVEMSRVPDPPKRECPTDIELLLRDYSRAREEAKTEIAMARLRLRERTEQEKRRLEQQAFTQAVKDDMRLRMRVSNSTLCTGSNLSLSSGPTSGYNSSNAALLKDGTSPSIQITEFLDKGLKVRTQPPMIHQSLKSSQTWLSAQDIRLESSSSGSELQSSPSASPARQHTCSFGFPSSFMTSYKNISDGTLTSAISEVHFASGGDISNLLAGKATAGWRHQGLVKGVHTFHKPSSRPSAHGFLGAMELERSLTSMWNLIRDHSKIHLYHRSLKSAWTRSLDNSTRLIYLLTDPSSCHLKQPRDFCCLSTESKQGDMWVLAMQSVFEESLPRPSVDTVRGEMFPSAWILQPSQKQGRDVVVVIYLLQVDLGTPSLPQRLVNEVARKQAAVIADLDSFLSL